MFAGLSVALYTNHINPLDKIAEIILAILGSSLVIGAAGTLNNIYDRDIDSIMDRVKNRPTVTGAITLAQALWLGGGMSVLGLALLWLASPLAALFGFFGTVRLFSRVYNVVQAPHNLQHGNRKLERSDAATDWLGSHYIRF